MPHHKVFRLAGPGALAALTGEHRPARILLIGDHDLTPPADTAVRRTGIPPGVLPAGAFLLAGDGGWDAIVFPEPWTGDPRGHALEDLPPGAPELEGFQWFAFLWKDAEACTAPTRFAVGDVVRFAGTNRTGTVQHVTVDANGEHYRVLATDGVVENTDAPDLEPAPVDASDPRAWLAKDPVKADQLALALTRVKLTNPLTDTVYSYLSSKTVFRPYQFKPVLKLINGAQDRLLIADEVGLGKTIEAGLVWNELDQRVGTQRVLVVCPASLVGKWRSEMQRRFDRTLTILDRFGMEEMLTHFRSGEQQKPFFGVVSVERLRSSQFLANLVDVQPAFDLVIADEAHVFRNRGTRSFDLGEFLADWADVLIFLSATPVNLGRDDLFNLVNLLSPEQFPSSDLFAQQLLPNRHLNSVAARLLESRDDPGQLLEELTAIEQLPLAATVVKKPEYQKLQSLLGAGRPLTWEEVAAAKHMLGELNVLSSILSRTRKVDVPDAKATRSPKTINVKWSDDEANFYLTVKEWATRQALSNNGVVGFATVMPLRQAASCIPAMVDLLRTKLAHVAEDDDTQDAEALEQIDLTGDTGLPTRDFSVTTAEEENRSLADLERDLSRLLHRLDGVDTKYDRFEKELGQVVRSGQGPVMVFSFFRRTIAYLSRRLSPNYRVGVMHGGVKMAERQRIMDDFRDGRYDILLLSEVGSEGLDFEFCNVLVNYDMPWNPMRVEQRIGRLDRFGQKHEKIYIFNFHVPGTIETDIFERLYERINIFKESIGDLEPILQQEFADVGRVVLDGKLSEKERQRRLEAVAVAVETRKRELDSLEEARDQLAGIDQLLIDGFERDRNERGRFVGPSELERLVRDLVDRTDGYLSTTSTSGIFELRGDKALAQTVGAVRGQHPGVRGGTDLAVKLRSGTSVYLTFDADLASHRDLDLVTLRHPLVQAALRLDSHDGLPFGRVQLESAPVGRYLAALYLVTTSGLRPRLELACIAVDLDDLSRHDQVGDALLAAIATGNVHDPGPLSKDGTTDAFEVIDAAEAAMRGELRAQRSAENEALVDAQVATKSLGYELKIRRARDTLKGLVRDGRDESIQRMYRGRIANLEVARDVAIAKLDEGRNLSVTSRAVALTVVSGTGRPRG